MFSLLSLPAAQAAPPAASLEDVPVHVSVRGTGQTPVTHAYVAFVPRDRALSDPVREIVTTAAEGSVALPPGGYVVVTAADGYDLSHHMMTINRRRPDLTVSLTPAHTASGTVVDAAGKPIAGARVSNALAATTPSGLSPAALQAFGERLHTTTDASGNWELRALNEGQTPLVIEAAGYGPVRLMYDPAVGRSRVTLQKGASLKATLDRTDPDIVINFAPKAQSGQTPPSLWQQRIWGRAATSATLQWDTLVPGQYRILAVVPDPLRFTEPVQIGEVTVAADHPAEVAVKVPPAPARQSAYVRFLVPESANLDELHAFVRQPGAGAAEARHAVEDVFGGKVIDVAGTANPADAYLTTKSQIIAASLQGPNPDRRAVKAAETRQVLRGDGKLRIMVPAGTALPSFVNGVAGECGHTARFVLPAAVGKDGTVALPLPVPCRVLTVYAEGFAPLALATSIQAGERKFLGVHRLLAPVTAEIHVVRVPSGAVAAQAVIEASVRRDGNLLSIARQVAGSDGRFVMKNVPAGEEVTFQARDAKTQVAGPAKVVRIEPGGRAVIDPLEINDPSSLTVAPEFEPDFKGLFPTAAIVEVAIEREGADKDRKSAGISSDKPEATFRDVTPARYHLVAICKIDDAMQALDAGTAAVAAGEDKRVSPKVKPLIFTGQVTSHGQGVAATVSIGDQPSPDAVRRRVQTLDDGTFKVILARNGIYDVQARRNGPAYGNVDVGPVLFDASSPKIAIELPEASMQVRVTRGGQPLARADVVADTRVDDPDGGGVSRIVRRVKTGDDGAATLEGLTAGTWTVQASTADGAVAQKTTALTRSDHADLTLELEDGSSLEGTVTFATATPAAAASVDCMFLSNGGLQAARADTDVDGHFAIHLSKPLPDRLQCGVSTTDGAIGAFSTPPTKDAQFVLPAATGALTIADWGQRVIPDRFWIVSDDGHLFDLSWVARKIGRFGAPLVVPRFPSGKWSVVRVASTAQLLALGNGMAHSAPTVTTLGVTPGQNLTIRIQSETAASAGAR